jgi:hypothetical protein
MIYSILKIAFARHSDGVFGAMIGIPLCSLYAKDNSGGVFIVAGKVAGNRRGSSRVSQNRVPQIT